MAISLESLLRAAADKEGDSETTEKKLREEVLSATNGYRERIETQRKEAYRPLQGLETQVLMGNKDKIFLFPTKHFSMERFLLLLDREFDNLDENTRQTIKQLFRIEPQDKTITFRKINFPVDKKHFANFLQVLRVLGLEDIANLWLQLFSNFDILPEEKRNAMDTALNSGDAISIDSFPFTSHALKRAFMFS